MTANEAVLGGWLGRVRKALYRDTLPADRPYQEQAVYFEQEKLLKEALTWPAAECKRLGWPDPGVEIFEELIREALKKILLHGTADITTRRNRAAYFWKVVQDEFTHGRERWWGKVKAREQRLAVGSVLDEASRAIGAEPSLTDLLAAAHELVKNRGGRPKKKASPEPDSGEIQSDLFQ